MDQDPHPRPAGPEGTLDGLIQVAGTGEYDRKWGRLRKTVSALATQGRATVAWLERQPTLPRLVILYGTSAPLLSRLLRWCGRHGVPLVCDLVEWYDGRQVTGGCMGPFYLSNEYAMRFQNPRTAGSICISRLLERSFGGPGHPVVRIPPTLDMGRMPASLERSPSDRIRLVYAGAPGRKDLLGNAIRALKAVDPEGRRFHLKLLGVDETWTRTFCPDYPPAAVELLGRRSHEEVLQAVREADFSILLRPQLKYANAGFPTKVVESLACGTPVICNLTSDLADHVRHRREGLVCASEDTASVVKVLEEATTLTQDDLAQMRIHARLQAERALDIRSHQAELRAFLAAVCRDGA